MTIRICPRCGRVMHKGVHWRTKKPYYICLRHETPIVKTTRRKPKKRRKRRK